MDDFDELGPPIPCPQLAALIVFAAICGGIAICALGFFLCCQPVNCDRQLKPIPACPGSSVDPPPMLDERTELK